MLIRRNHSLLLGVLAIAAIVAAHAYISFSCYGHDFRTFQSTFATFLLLPLLPAMIALATANALRAVGACLLLAPWLFLAYQTDCTAPGPGGASMIYVAVFLWGTVSSLIGVLITGPVLRALGSSVGGR